MWTLRLRGQQEDDNIIMLLLSNDSPSSAAVADLLHSSLITMVESCISCTRYEIFVNKLQRYICSTLNPFMAAWLLPARCRCYQSHVMCLVLQSRMRPYSRILFSPWFCYDQLYFQEWQDNMESREASLSSCWCRSSVVFLTSQHHQPPRHVQEEYYLHSDSFVIHNFSILFWCSLVAYAVLRDNDVLRQYSTDITIDNDGGHHGWAIFWAESSQGDIDG